MINFLQKVISYFNRSNDSICSICGERFPDNSLKMEGELALCTIDHEELISNTWIKATSGKSDPSNPKAALTIQEYKDILKKNKISSYILVEYSETNGVIISEFNLYIKGSEINHFHQLIPTKPE